MHCPVQFDEADWSAALDVDKELAKRTREHLMRELEDPAMISADGHFPDIDQFTETLGLQQYTLYVQDYGAPVGYRLAANHPDRIQALVVQNGNAYGAERKRCTCPGVLNPCIRRSRWRVG